MVNQIDYKSLMERVARRLLGEPNKQYPSATEELRWGAKNSFSVNRAEGTWYDWEIKEGGGVLDLIRRELPGEDAIAWLRREGYINGAAPSANVFAKGVTRYFEYRDERGDPLYRVVRVEDAATGKKTLNPWQERADGRGGWLKGKGVMAGARLLLYRLADLLVAPLDAVVFVVEGEPKVELLRSWGLISVCNLGGAGKWPEGFDDLFLGRRVVILPDNDQPGARHAQVVAARLSGIASEVRIVELPGLGPKGDVVDWAKAGGTKEQFLKLAEAAPQWEPGNAEPGDGGGGAAELPELIIEGSDLTRTAKQLAELIAERRRFLFNGHEPIQVVHEAGGVPRAIPVTPESVRVFAHEICTPIKIVKGNEVNVTLSRDVANLYLNGLEGRWGLKPFNGITTAPILGGDGSLRVAHGYDEASGLWCHAVPEVRVPERPTEEDAREALRQLRHFFRTFPFADAAAVRDDAHGVNIVDLSRPIGLDESSFITGLMTSVCRASLLLAPGVLATAPAISGAGTGKGLAVKAICIIASGAPPSAFTAGHDTEELDKRLTAALVEARPAVFLDNYNAKILTSDILASTLTENPCEVRPMGHTKMVRLHTRTLVAMTGNAVAIAEDMARRVIVIYFDAKCEDPELRPFKPGFLESVHEHRAALLGYVLTIWRWGRQNAARLKTGKPLGSFEVWAQWCRDPLITLGCKDPVDRLAKIKADDPERKHLLAVFDAWWEAHKDKPRFAKDLDNDVIRVIDDEAGFRDGVFRYSRQAVAGWLQSHINTRLGGYTLTAREEGPRSKRTYKYELKYEPPLFQEEGPDV
jgi:hypothetical protein